MKVLVLCNRVPFEAKDGGSRVIQNTLLGMLDAKVETHLFCLNTSKHPYTLSTPPKEYSKLASYHSRDINTQVNAPVAFLNLFSKTSYQSARFYKKSVAKQIVSLLKKVKPDVVHIESLFMSAYIPAIKENSKVKIVYRSHNIEHQIWEEVAKSKGLLSKKYLGWMVKRIKQEEIIAIENSDLTLCISKEERAYFQSLSNGNIEYLAPGFQVPKQDFKKVNHNKLFHLGAMDWQPNVLAIESFLRDNWNDIHASFPKLEFHLAGRNFPNWDVEAWKKKNVIIDGEVLGAYDYMQSNGILVVPLQHGSGIRIKILEAFMLGVPVISTSKGAQGLDIKDKKQVLIANTSDEFLAALQWISVEPKKLEEIRENAYQFMLENYSLQSVTSQLLKHYKNA